MPTVLISIPYSLAYKAEVFPFKMIPKIKIRLLLGDFMKGKILKFYRSNKHYLVCMLAVALEVKPGLITELMWYLPILYHFFFAQNPLSPLH